MFCSLRALLGCAILLFGGCVKVGEETPPAGLRVDIPELAQCKQLIVVTAPDWHGISAQLRCFERQETTSAWIEVFPVSNIVIGRNGLAWGIGLHGTHPEGGPFKQEGDGRAPAGVFNLGEAFGYALPTEANVTRFPYKQLTPNIEGVDDAQSRYYNRIVDASSLPNKDWNSSEKMRRDDELYRWGVVVGHNQKPFQGFGSCIFLHIWQDRLKGTSGCTAMSADHMERLIRWLNKNHSPILVQLPQVEYIRLKGFWMLP